MTYSVTDHIHFTEQGVLYYPNIMQLGNTCINVIPHSPSGKYALPLDYFHRN